MQTDLEYPFSQMMDNFLGAKENEPTGQKSSFWDVFPENYEQVIANSDVWPCFLRNSLSANFNFDLDKWRPDALAKGYMHGPWESRKNLDFTTLIPEVLEESAQIKEITDVFLHLASICGSEFVLNNLGNDTGSPAVAVLNIRHTEGRQPAQYRIGLQDLYLVYYFWQISRAAQSSLGEKPTIVEIVGGFGGMISKFKELVPKSRCINFDLPEVNAVQTYYLTKRFPSARILGFVDFKQRGAAIFEEEFDFLVLPGWLIQEMPAGTVDLAANTSSMMEMTDDVINFYFTQLQRTVRVGGTFACFNRNNKVSVLKNYPFDERWRILLSQTSVALGPGHHEVIVERTEDPQIFTVPEALKSIPPFSKLV